MDAAQRRLRSVAGHLVEPEIGFAHGIDSNLLGALEQSLESSPYPVIIGGMVLDIVAKPDSHPFPGTTTPGKVYYLCGGVARNVVECMTKLGSKPFMISVVGFDMAGSFLLKLWESAELPTEGLLHMKNISTPIVSNIFDGKGELFAGVASVGAVEKFLSPDWIWKFKNRIHSAPIMMVDANLHPDSLEAACRLAVESETPVWFEPVSVTKSARIASIVDFITCASPNENELIAMANALTSPSKFSFVQREAITGNSPQTIYSLFDLLKPAIHLLMGKGIQLLVVTLGPDGVFLCFKRAPDFIRNEKKKSRRLYELVSSHCPSHRNQKDFMRMEEMGSCDFRVFHIPAPVAEVASLTGAGDCLVGGMLSSLCSGLDVMRSAAVGIAAAKAAVEDSGNVPSEISLVGIASEAGCILSACKQLM